MGFFNVILLLGLVVVAIPPIIHLLNRRRYEVVDWGAMQFLQVSEVTRRRLMIEELLLMLLRMGLLALLVLALAGPYLTSTVVARLGSGTNRDVVLIFDGSYSMGATGERPGAGDKTPHEAARAWALDFVRDLAPGDGVAVLQAKQQVVPVVAELSRDHDRVAEYLEDNLPPPAGGCDWRPALQQAQALLAQSERAEREVILLSDGQRFGWADPDSARKWKYLKGELGWNQPSADNPLPRLWVVNLAEGRPADPPNWTLAPLRSNRPVVAVGRAVRFRTEMVLRGQEEYAPPHKVRLEVDGKYVRDLQVPRQAKLDNGKVPFTFEHRFATSGSHLVTVHLMADPPPDERPAGFTPRDVVPGDDRQHFAVEVVEALPVLLVDGERKPSPTYRGSDFLQQALSPTRDPNPAVKVRVVPITEFTPTLLGAGSVSDGTPLVLILHDVDQLTDEQAEAVGRFLADGGGVLVTLGMRPDPDFYNEKLYRGGEGWLPARLEGVEGDEDRPEDGVRPAPGSTNHPTLELFRQMPAGGLTSARFPRWWKLTTPGRHTPGVPVAMLRSATTQYPFLVEGAYPAEEGQQAGRVLVCSVPLDNSWGTNLPDLAAFVPLAHELVYYLAGARSADFNLQPGQPLRYRIAADDPPPLDQWKLRPPVREQRPLHAPPSEEGTYPAQINPRPRGAVLVYPETRETGVYELTKPEGGTVYYVVQPDARESDLTPADEKEREGVAEEMPFRYENDRNEIVQVWVSESHRQELWWLLLVGVVALLCGEVWFTRRMVRNQ
jgi:hypothetical protein